MEKHEGILDDVALWEKFNKVLPSTGLSVDNICAFDVPGSMVCMYFEEKSSKSGWKYNNPKKIYAEKVASILRLSLH